LFDINSFSASGISLPPDYMHVILPLQASVIDYVTKWVMHRVFNTNW